MKMKFRYRYDKLQEELILIIKNTDIKFRIRKDRTIEFAKKWYTYIDNEANELRFDFFENPVIYRWSVENNINEMLHHLAEKNIPFIIENHDGIDFIIYDESDISDIIQIINKMGIIDDLVKSQEMENS